MMETTPIITYLGQSGFKLEYNNSTLIIDPSNKASGDYDGAIMYCTHKHNDHIGGVDIFLERNLSAILVCNEQTAAKFLKWGDRVKVVDDGETYANGPWSFRFVLLKHGLFRGIQNLAAVITAGAFSFAHCGDAVEFTDFPPEAVDVLLFQ
jgi:L-ascorbate metabolism protein UlaG (beta-lactamase superfamily)